MRKCKQYIVIMLTVMGLGMWPAANVLAFYHDDADKVMEEHHEKASEHQEKAMKSADDAKAKAEEAKTKALKDKDEAHAKMLEKRDEMQGHANEAIDERLTMMEDKLELTPEQQPAFDEWSNTVKEQANVTMDERAEQMDKLMELDEVTPADRMDAQIDMLKQQEKNLKELKGPTEDLWEVLDDNQREAIQEALSRPFGDQLDGAKGFMQKK